MDKCSGAVCIYGTRIFDSAANGIDLSKVVSFTSSGATKARLIHPSFHVPAGLHRDFESLNAIIGFFDYICGTLLSENHLREKDWPWFLARNCSPRLLKKMLLGKPHHPHDKTFLSPATGAIPKDALNTFHGIVERPSADNLQDVFYPSAKDKRFYSTVAHLLIRSIYDWYFKQFKPIQQYMGISPDVDGEVNISAYNLLEILYGRFSSTKELTVAVIRRFKLKKGHRNCCCSATCFTNSTCR